ncbi:FCD domain-containing protein [Alicyclobacillus dauci]|uniref:FCD domain-containing protein n=1 Tax=Alicyclobacillus dauci TaxID=1475485 RepID=A0ABY6YZZ6_9BACL|nr:FCD domain-containing protein [Alicyclobacillus dauci]WAH35691.1 FCD domain-containing protein [Alicyclobacillus dauci]
MQSHYDANDLISYADCNAILHKTLIRTANHITATRILDTLHSQSVRFQYRTNLSRGRPQKSLGEHRAIVEAVNRHNPQGAEQATREHLSGVLMSLRDVFKGTSRVGNLGRI